MKGKVTFNKSGSSSISGRLTIPAVLIELMKITEDEREVEITFKNGKLIIEKVKNAK
ncbi:MULTISPECIES: PemI [Clostridium]|uniref:AbrB/MazE/SpoVT family DNA-binding domain-containing protein n=1 Tax=Clostridium TaxID=1485 RepID=UPI0019674466|nr:MULTISPECIES: PemI [Clostridium]MBN1079230.1 PemI [Clostridium botulinum]